ncbi:MAG: rhodanese-like domain-containing protein [Bacteroidetes bacterium]|nr:rhodanese-like domain-containing protein [Bacteroidota bacterium]
MLNFLNSLFSGGSGDENLTEVIQKGAFLVDVRTPEEFAMGSAPGAVNIPLDKVATRIREFDGKDKIVVFCRSGNRSSQAKRILEAKGHKEVINGGTWQNVRNHIK